MKKYIFLFLFKLMILMPGYGQIDSITIDSSFLTMEMMETLEIGQNYSSNILTPSPETAALNKYIDYNVSNKTGIPDINIPIYTIKSGSLSLPINISYHASGRKVTDETGAIGLGWNLNSGGIITRTVRGRPDDGLDVVFPEPMANATNIDISNEEDFELLASFDEQRFEIPIALNDSEYDIFTYSLPDGNSGRFIIANDSGNSIGISIPYSSIKINPVIEVLQSGLTRLGYIEITDEAGILYRFGNSPYSISNNLEYRDNANNVTGWFLSEIISAKKQDTITFEYTEFWKTYNFQSQYITFRDDCSACYNATDCYAWKDQYNLFQQIYSQPISTKNYLIQRLKEINFKNGKIILSQEGDDNNIEKLDIYGFKNELISSVKFKRSNLEYLSLQNRYAQKLDSLVFTDKLGFSVETYKFEYYPSSGGTFYDNGNYDWWGYYNQNNQNPSMVPSFDIYYIGELGQSAPTTINSGNAAYRDVNLTYTKAGVLKKITYPTGGSTEFIYEQNKYISSENIVKEGGGLRIYQIKTSDNLGGIITKTYKYGVNECGYGIIPVEPRKDYLISENIYIQLSGDGCGTASGLYNGGSFRERVFSSDFPEEIAEYINKPIEYPEVTEYLGIPISNKGKTIYTYNIPYKYIYPLDNSYSSILHIPQFNYWEGGYLTNKIDSGFNSATNNYFAANEVTYYYSQIGIDTFNGIHLAKRIESLVQCPTDVYKHMATVLEQQVYVYNNYHISTGYNQLDSIDWRYHQGNEMISKNTSFIYNNLPLVIEENSTDSKGENIKKKYYYPSDYANFPYIAMKDSNILNELIKEEEYYNSTIVNSTQIHYKDWGNNIIMPEYIENENDLMSISDTIMRYIDYDDKGNLQSLVKKDGIKTNYIWGYNQSYPIAKIESSSSDTISDSVNDNNLSGSNEISDINDDISYLQGLLSSYINDIDYLVTLYTYKPLVGITSETDPAGRTTYYEYDDFGRLKLIRDQNDNIIEKYEYNYANQ